MKRIFFSIPAILTGLPLFAQTTTFNGLVNIYSANDQNLPSDDLPVLRLTRTGNTNQYLNISLIYGGFGYGYKFITKYYNGSAYVNGSPFIINSNGLIGLGYSSSNFSNGSDLLQVNGSGSFTSSLTAFSFSGAGTGLTGTASGLNIGGNSATSTNSSQWGTLVSNWTSGVQGGGITALLGVHQNGTAYGFTTGAVQSFLGLGANAYTSTPYLPAANISGTISHLAVFGAPDILVNGSASYSTYTPDGLFGSGAVPIIIGTPGGGIMYMGYQDDEGGQYNPAIGFGTGTVLGTNQVAYRNSISASTDGSLVFKTGINGTNPNSERMRIESSGNVGIGTTNPQSTLSVNGTITGKQVTVTQTGWPDFVFNKDYRLKPLSMVADYIVRNNHLPDMPSANEVEAKGLNLGSMQQKQMQKIEELTLYVIDLKKENDQLKDEVEKLKCMMNEILIKAKNDK